MKGEDKMKQTIMGIGLIVGVNTIVMVTDR